MSQINHIYYWIRFTYKPISILLDIINVIELEKKYYDRMTQKIN